MWFVVIGVLLLLMKATEFGPVGQWGWGWVLLPFGLAVLWWAFSDATGLTQKRAMDKMEERKEKRRQRDMENLGLDHRRDKHVRAVRDAKRRANLGPDGLPEDRTQREPKL